MSILKRFNAVRGYLAYRVETEVQYLRHFSPTFQYFERTYRWWRYNFPEYINPSSLPNPPGTPPVQPTWIVAPLAVLQQRIPVWEMKLDNLLLFGHAMPTNAEVEYRKSYLQWADDFKRGVYRPLPVEDIVQDTRSVHVPVYEYPFVHEELWAFATTRTRAAAARALPFLNIQPPLDLPPLPRHWQNFVMVRDEEGRWDVARPAQLLLPVETTPSDGDAERLDAPGQDGAVGRSQRERSQPDGGEEMRAAADDMRAAASDAWHIVRVARASASSMTPMALEFVRDRLDTLRAALSEFLQGYSQGTREVEGGAVDVAEDARQFYQRMLHTLPDALASLDSRLQPPAGAAAHAQPPPASPPRGATPGSAAAVATPHATAGHAAVSSSPGADSGAVVRGADGNAGRVALGESRALEGVGEGEGRDAVVDPNRGGQVGGAGAGAGGRDEGQRSDKGAPIDDGSSGKGV